MPEQPIEESKFDVLTDVLDTLRFRGSIFYESDLAAPWGVALATSTAPRFHINLSGVCYVGAAGVDPVRVEPGEIVLLADGDAHWIADRPDRNLVSDTSLYDACELGKPLFQQGEFTNRIMCGVIHIDQESFHPVLNSLTGVVHFAKLILNEPIWSTVATLKAKIDQTGRYSSRIVDRLTEVLFLQLMEHHTSENLENAGFMGALRDRRINHALALIHENPAFDWALTSLGERVGMSRATLTRHFKSSVGVAPMTYLANWRLVKAYNEVKYTTKPLKEIAALFGFASVSTMNKAFRRYHDCTPAKLRHKQH